MCNLKTRGKYMQQIAISILIKFLIGSNMFNVIEASVIEWAKEQLSGKEKRHGVLAEMQRIGIKASEWIVRLAIELAVGKLRDYK